MTPRDDATERQVQAADPAASTWLSANAGSGKTRVLTDRVARLLLAGTDPQRILCLTYTKAAASEMQNRLFRRLGTWAMAPEDRLRAELSHLGVESRIDADALAKARRLFARAIETPGGLKVQTIHAFAAALLRRFPLEAGVSPRFVELDERTAALLRDEIVETLAAGTAAGAVAGIARLVSAEDLGKLVSEIAKARATFEPPLDRAAALARYGVSPGETLDGLVAGTLTPEALRLLAAVVPTLRQGSKTDKDAADVLAGLRPERPRLADLVKLEGLFLTKSGKAPFSAKIDTLPTKGTRAALGELLEPLQDLMQTVEAVRWRRIGLMAAEATVALHAFAGPFLQAYDARKAARGGLDFDDLILKAGALLRDPSVAAWVLWRLDGGIDHVLVDEAQDTSPAQWTIIERLTQEFAAGEGARDLVRTLFVVGDKKQSIYSFQGADLRVFDSQEVAFGARLEAGGQPLGRLALEHSFRSSDAILRVTDATFAAVGLGGPVEHLAHRADMPGRVDLWEVIAPAATAAKGDWHDPVDLVGDENHFAVLADKVAREVRSMIDAGTRIPTRDGVRAMHAGDVLILVQKRSVLFRLLIRACKAEGLAIAGADLLKLEDELAVQDIVSLMTFLATPEDDLALAEALRSPLFGWSEAALHDLAAGREDRFLWRALQRSGAGTETLAILEDLRDRADFLRPYELIERCLTRHGGRTRLLARLGMEAEEGIDALLDQALAYEAADVPSLTGFLGWLQAGNVAQKRQADAGGRLLRVMTVHGAKGLEAPVVILPDCREHRAPAAGPLQVMPDGWPGWRPSAQAAPEPHVQATLAEAGLRDEENRRLLYVAMTRAESWLIVAAAGKAEKSECWWQLVAAGMRAAGDAPLPDRPDVRRHAFGEWPAPDARVADAPPPRIVLPDWANRPAPAADRAPPPLSPSNLGGEKALPGAPSEDGRGAGTALHLLLERLPGMAPSLWDAAAPGILAGLDTDAARALAAARDILGDPALATLFGPGTLAEVGIAAPVAALGGRTVLGSIDRLVIDASRVLAVDFKSNATVPVRPADVPDGILRQMGAYAAALGEVWPDRRIETAILWTATRTLMPLPPEIVRSSLASIPPIDAVEAGS